MRASLLVTLLLAICVLAGCSDNRIPPTDAGSDGAPSPTCSPACNSGQICFGSAPGASPDAGAGLSCTFVPSQCASNPSSCDCLGFLCPGPGGYQCAYDALKGYVTIECL